MIPFEPLWEQYKRIIKPCGAIALFGSQPFTSALVMSNSDWFKYEWIWEKHNGTNFASVKYQPFKAHENILIFGCKRVNYYPIKEKRAESSLLRDKVGTRRFVIQSTTCSTTGIKKIGCELIQTGLRMPFSYQRFTKEDWRNKLIYHPTRKPTALIEYLIKTYTLKGELILDNTAGSGTLAIAAINTDRNYICIEKDEHYFEVMRDRIEGHDPNAVKPKPKLPKKKPVNDEYIQLSLFNDCLNGL